MQTIKVELPDALAREIAAAVDSGTFADASEAVLAALRDFVSRGRFKLLEEQQLRDIEWAKDQRNP